MCYDKIDALQGAKKTNAENVFNDVIFRDIVFFGFGYKHICNNIAQNNLLCCVCCIGKRFDGSVLGVKGTCR